MNQLTIRRFAIGLLGFLVLLVSQREVDADSSGYATAAAYLRAGVGARVLGMGGAAVAHIDDATAVYWNPAGLVQIKSREIASMLSRMSLDREYNFINYAQKLGRTRALAVSWINFGVNSIEGRDSSGQPTGDFNDSENAFFLTYSIRLDRRWSLGANLKYLIQKLEKESGSGFGLDVGINYKPFIVYDLMLGLVVQNIGSKINWSTGHEDEVLPTVKVGFAYRAFDKRMILATDLEKIKGQEAKFHLGLEYWLRDIIALRGGWDRSNPTLGASYRFSIYQLDYGYMPDREELGDMHRFSLLARF